MYYFMQGLVMHDLVIHVLLIDVLVILSSNLQKLYIDSLITYTCLIHALTMKVSKLQTKICINFIHNTN